MKLAIYGISFDKKVFDQVRGLFDYLEGTEIDVSINEPFLEFLHSNCITEINLDTYSSPEDIHDVDFFMSIGGDGTLLETITYIGNKQTPIIAINAGRLGFLADITIDKSIEAIDAILHNNYSIDTRNLIALETEDDLFGTQNYALNEFAIQKRDNSSMIVVHTYLDGEFLNSYWADGLLISTPTGSTGYNLSCGGPLVMPQTNNFIISPVNPHNLNVRPMIVPDNCELTFKIEGRSRKFLISLDSRSKSIYAKTELKIKKAPFNVKLVSLVGDHFFKTLRNKLNWGMDKRNY